MNEAIVVFDKIPPAIVRPNSRRDWRQQAAARKELRKEGRIHAEECLEAGVIPVMPPYTVHYRFRVKRHVDLESLVSSCKAWIDGIADSALMQDDRHVKYHTAGSDVAFHETPRTEITIRERR